MKFLCDHMLGTLAKWLRFLGYDTAYPGPLDDTALLELAQREGRVLLTRDKELASRGPETLGILSDRLDEQLQEVRRAFQITAANALTRCSVCNGQVARLGAEDVRGAVPESVLSRHTEFWRCPDCRRVYWKGSHYEALASAVSKWTA
jgi:hypothetical protein